MTPESTISSPSERKVLLRGALHAMAAIALYFVLKAGAVLAQAFWSLPGLLLPVADAVAFAALLAYLTLVALARRRRERATGVSEHVPISSALGCGILIALWFAIALMRVGLSDFSVTGRDALGSLSPALERGDRWEANRLSYLWRPLQRGDLVVVRRGTGQTALVVGLPGDSVAYRSGRLEVVKPAGGVGEGERERQALVPPGCVAVVLDRPSPGCVPSRLLPAQAPGPLPQMVKQAEIRARLVAVWYPFGHARSL